MSLKIPPAILLPLFRWMERKKVSRFTVELPKRYPTLAKVITHGPERTKPKRQR